MYRYFTKNQTYRYIDNLQQFADSYNRTPHRSLNFIAPINVNNDNKVDLWAFMYLKQNKNQLKKIKPIKTSRKQSSNVYAFKMNDMVRISHLKITFQRSYDEQWTSEIFKINSRMRRQGIAMYTLKDFLGELIKGNFYESELQRVQKNEETLWHIEKVISKRKRGGHVECLVKWKNWPKRFNSYVRQDMIKDISADH